MKPKALLICAEKEKTELDYALRKALAPWQYYGDGSEPDAVDVAVEGYRSDYSIEDAISFRIWGDLTRSGLQGKDATEFVKSGLAALRVGYGVGYGEDYSALSPARDLVDLYGPVNQKIWIAREVSRSDLNRNKRTLDRRDFYVRGWAGTLSEIHASIANLNDECMEFGRETVSIQFYNLSAAAQKTFQIAVDLGVTGTEQKA